MPARLDGWDRRLHALLQATRMRPFAWGTHDCCSFALEAYRALIGEAAPNPYQWDSLLSAQRLLHRRGGVAGLAGEWFGAPVAGWKSGRRGDIGLVDARRGLDSADALAVIVGAHACGPGPAGLEFVSLSAVRRVWRIGE
jgi:hypothetical protein